jgi:radical SAM superfamily enzyme YgiQ (UPF0313 family)
LSDPCFGSSSKWLGQVLYGLKQADLPVLYWAETRADKLTPEMLDMFAELRFVLFFGVESLSPNIISIMRKSFDPHRYIESSLLAIQGCFQRQISCILGFIANYPGETPSSSEKTLQELDKLLDGATQPTCNIVVQSYKLFPGNHAFESLHQYQREFGFETRAEDWWKRKQNGATRLFEDNMGSRKLIKKYGWNPYFYRPAWQKLRLRAIGKMPTENFSELFPLFLERLLDRNLKTKYQNRQYLEQYLHKLEIQLIKHEEAYWRDSNKACSPKTVRELDEILTLMRKEAIRRVMK